MNELLRRIDEKDYLTEREHREFLTNVDDRLKVLDILTKYYFIGLVMYLCDDYKDFLFALVKAGVNDKNVIPNEEDFNFVHNWIDKNDIDIDMI